MSITNMMGFLRRPSGTYEKVSRVDNECCEYDCPKLCSRCIVAERAKDVKMVVVRRKRDEAFYCERCQTLVDERWMDRDGRSLLQSPVPVLKKTALK